MEPIIAGILVILVALTFLMLRHDIRTLHADVRTLKGQQSIGALTSEGESRRVGQIPHDERTATEQRHLDAAAAKEAPQGVAKEPE